MLLPPPKPAQSPVKKLLDLATAANARLGSLFISRPTRRRAAHALFCHHSLAGAQVLEARLMLTGPTAESAGYDGTPQGTLNIPAYAGLSNYESGGNGPLSTVEVSGPSYGTLTLNSDGSFTYTNTQMMGMSDSFQFKAYDGTNYSNVATVTINLTNPSQPSTESENYSVLHDHTLSVSAPGVLSNDMDPNHLHLSAVLTSPPSSGSLTLNSDGSLSYTPATHFAGYVNFSYEAYDGNKYSSATTDTIDVTNQPPGAESDQYALPNGQTFTTTAASGVLANDSDPDGDSLTASLVSGASHGSLSFNSDGSFSYTPNPGWIGYDNFTYQNSDGIATSNTASVTLQTQYSVLSASDETKVPVDTIHAGQQILSDPLADQAITSPLPAGGSGGTTISAAPADGAPATAHNLSLVYDSVLAQPDQVIEADLGLSTASAASDTIAATLAFNGLQQSPVYYTMTSLNGSDSHIHLAQQIDTSGLASGRYPWSLSVTSPDMAAPTTISGYVNVVNDSASPFGKGWDMPGLYRLFQNSVPNVPSGVLLSTGDGGAWYYSQNENGSYSSPNGPLAFSSLTPVSGGGWQLLTHEGVTFNFNSSGYLTSRVERTGEATSYNWSGAELISIVDQWGRAVDLHYTNSLLSSISDYANSLWTIAHSGTNLTSVTEPDPGNGQGAPVWQYAYSGNYMSSETDPNDKQSSFVLDSFHRLNATDLPGGANTSGTSEQDFGYGSASSSNPANLTLASSMTPSDTDANGNQSFYQTNAFGLPISETDPYGNVSAIHRDANGLPTQLVLPAPATGDANPATDIYYDSTGDETYATGASPTYGTYTYTADSFGQWATFTDSTGKEWLRTFDSKGDILTESDPSGSEVSWTYDTYGRPLTMAMPAPNNAVGTVTVTYHYDTDERLTEIVWPDSSNEQFGYNADDRQTTSQDEDGHVTTNDVDVLGRVVSVTNAAGGVTSTVYDKDNNVISTEDALGNVTGFQFNSRNELVQETLPPQATGDAAPVLAWTYDANGNELTYTDSMGRVTSEAWDKLDRMISQTLPAASNGDAAPTITIGYDNLSRKTSEVDALGGTTTWAYANADINQLTSEMPPPPSGSGTGPTTSYFYDPDGRQTQAENALDQFTTTTFTADGQTASVEDNLGNTTTDTYGNGGELLGTTDALDHAASTEYDSRYRPIESINADGGVTQITLDPAGNTVAMLDPDNNQTTWTFSPVNQPLTETTALGTTTATYNLDGAATSIEDADGRVREFAYNNDQQLTAENWMQGNTVVDTMAYAYDLAGELTSAGDGNSAYAFAYNGDAQVTSVDNGGTANVPHVVLSQGYDLGGDMTSQSATINGTADFANSFAFNADQQLTTVQQQDVNGGDVIASKEFDYSYNTIGQFTGVADYNFIGVGPRLDTLAGTYSYDTAGRLTGLDYTSEGGQNAIDNYSWAYNAGNLVTSFTTDTGTADYAYDPTNQLTSATYSGTNQPANESYSYEANGNRNMAGYSTAADNLVASDGTFNYQHDADGNSTVRTRIADAYASDYKTAYVYDYRNRLTDVEYYDNNGVLTKHVHYVFDVFDNLIGEEDDDTGDGTYDNVQWYAVDASPSKPAAGQPPTEGAQPLLQFNSSGAVTERNLLGLNPAGVDAIMAQEAVDGVNQGGTVTWMVDDNLGSDRNVVNNNGSVVDTTVYNAFGQTASQSNPSATAWTGFASGHNDASTSMVLDAERAYNPTTGGWNSKDPIGLGGGDPNTGRYSGNSPTNAIDPTGETPDWVNYVPYAVTPMFMWPLIAAWQAQQQGANQQIAAQQQAMAQQGMAEHLAMMAQMVPHVLQGPMGQIGPPNWFDTALDYSTDFFAGYANIVTAGYYNQWIGGNAAFVNTNSWSYTIGQGAGWAWWAGVGVATAQAVAAKAAAQAAAAAGQQAALEAAAAEAAAEGAATAAAQQAAHNAVMTGIQQGTVQVMPWNGPVFWNLPPFPFGGPFPFPFGPI